MRKLVPINRRAEPGFYEAASVGQPRFLVLPDEGDGAAALQLDASRTQRAFTFVPLTSKSIGKGRWAAELGIVIDKADGRLATSECPIGAAILQSDGVAIQTLDEGGMYGFLSLHINRDVMRSSPFPLGFAYRWRVLAERNGDEEQVLFESHPRSADPGNSLR